MSTSNTESGPSDTSTSTLPFTQIRRPYQRRLWMEPLEAFQMPEKAQAVTDFKTTKSWQQYPPKSSALPLALSFKELCSNYTNHLGWRTPRNVRCGADTTRYSQGDGSDNPALGENGAGLRDKPRRQGGLEKISMVRLVKTRQQHLRNQAGLQVKVYS
jgi:hypothetical protein